MSQQISLENTPHPSPLCNQLPLTNLTLLPLGATHLPVSFGYLSPSSLCFFLFFLVPPLQLPLQKPSPPFPSLFKLFLRRFFIWDWWIFQPALFRHVPGLRQVRMPPPLFSSGYCVLPQGKCLSSLQRLHHLLFPQWPPLCPESQHLKHHGKLHTTLILSLCVVVLKWSSSSAPWPQQPRVCSEA